MNDFTILWHLSYWNVAVWTADRVSEVASRAI